VATTGQKTGKYLAKPPWLRVRFSCGDGYALVRRLTEDLAINTVCEEAQCPNAPRCWNERTATFLILGNSCTRRCDFCAVARGPIGLPDAGEPERVAKAIEALSLDFVVITSVTRDDLADGGSAHFVRTIECCRLRQPRTLVEVLIPDFRGSTSAIGSLVDAQPNVLGHNVETVPRLYRRVRPGADYSRSLSVLGQAHRMNSDLVLKSGLMLGLGESEKEIETVMGDLREAGCRLLTLGQYLQPSKNHLPVERFVPPDEFEAWNQAAVAMGFEGVASGPLVRSSFRAGDLYRKARCYPFGSRKTG